MPRIQGAKHVEDARRSPLTTRAPLAGASRRLRLRRQHSRPGPRRAKGHHARADKVRGNLQQPGIGGKFENDWYAEHVPRTGFGPRNWRVGECVEGSQHLSALEHLMVDGKPCLSLVHAKENVSCRLANVANEPRAAANIMDEAAGASAPFDG